MRDPEDEKIAAAEARRSTEENAKEKEQLRKDVLKTKSELEATEKEVKALQVIKKELE